MNTLEQIVSQHPCPIIRAKIMENANVPNYEKQSALSKLTNLILYGINDWEDTKEGGKFWDAVYMNHTATYNDLKHLDLSYVPEPTPPTPKWLPIDRDNLPKILVAAINRNEHSPIVYTGTLNISDIDGSLYIQSTGGYVRLYDFTHYIPLLDLLNLPILE